MTQVAADVWTRVSDAWTEVASVYTPRPAPPPQRPDQKLPFLSFDINDGKSLVIHQSRGFISKRGETGSVVWPACAVVSHLLVHSPHDLLSVRSKNVVELGTGTGLLGLAAAARDGGGARSVVLSDLEATLQATTVKNLAANRDVIGTGVEVQLAEIVWGDDASVDHVLFNEKHHTNPLVDVVLFSDCVYNDAIVRPLVRTLDGICSKADRLRGRMPESVDDDEDKDDEEEEDLESVEPPHIPSDATRVIFGFELRTEDVLALFLEEMLAAGFTLWRVPWRWISSMFANAQMEPYGIIVYLGWKI